MKKFLTLFLSVLLLSCMLTCAASAEETNTTLDDYNESYTPVENSAGLGEDFIEIHTFAECHEMLIEDLQNSDGDVTPYAIVHCTRSEGIGRYIEQLVDTVVTRETRNCAHGAIGVTDVRNKYTDVYRQYCTLCTYEDSYSVTRYGEWVCKG